VREYQLENGDVFVMRGRTQQFYQHRVPPLERRGVKREKSNSEPSTVTWHIQFVRMLDADYTRRVDCVAYFYRTYRYGEKFSTIKKEPWRHLELCKAVDDAPKNAKRPRHKRQLSLDDMVKVKQEH
jgi:hypothetical protein